LFDKDADGNIFPNIKKIQKYFEEVSAEDGKKRKIMMISTGPTFAKYKESKIAGVAYDN